MAPGGGSTVLARRQLGPAEPSAPRPERAASPSPRRPRIAARAGAERHRFSPAARPTPLGSPQTIARQPTEVDTDGDSHLRDDGRGLGGAHPLRPPPRRAPRPHQGAARGLRPRRAAVLRHDERPLHHGDAHRHLGAGQAQPLLPAPPGRRADHVGLRLRRPPPRALQPVARRRPLARRHLDDARRDVARVRAGRRASPTRSRSSSSSAGSSTSPSASTRSSSPVLFALQKEGIQVVDGQQLMQQARVDQDAGRDPAPQPRVHDGRRRLRGALPRDAPGLPRERVRRARQQGPVRDGLRAGRGRQRDLRRALLAPPARLHRPRAAPGRPRLLRHPPELHGLPHVLLPHVRGLERVARRSSTPTSAAATTSTRRSR